MSFRVLEKALNELAGALEAVGCKLIIGGGFGLYLRQIELSEEPGVATLVSREHWCEPRTTADIDIFLETHIVASLEQMQSIRAALDSLGYAVIEEVKFLHFEKLFGPNERVELNFLTGPIDNQTLAAQVKFNRPRVRPKGNVELHAYLTNDAIGLSEQLIDIDEIGTSTGVKNIFVPHPSTFLLMKLHAFRDRLNEEAERSSQHAIDVYRIICMMSEGDFKQTQAFFHQNRKATPVSGARNIVDEYFASFDQMGFVRLQEHVLARGDFALNTMREVLQELTH